MKPCVYVFSSPPPRWPAQRLRRLTSHEALEGQGDAQTWKTHKQQLSELDAWQIDGKVGIRAPRDSGSGTLFWLQRQGYYDIRLSGPLGRGAARLTGREGAVSLEVAGQGRYQAESPEALLEEQLGWRLPVSHLLWWVRGLPAPDSKSRLTSTPTAAWRAWNRTAGRSNTPATPNRTATGYPSA